MSVEPTLDVTTFEILRHRLWEINDEMGLLARRLSASPAVYETGDFNTAIMTPDGHGLFVGVYIIRQGSTLDVVVQSVLEAFGDDIADGDASSHDRPVGRRPARAGRRRGDADLLAGRSRRLDGGGHARTGRRRPASGKLVGRRPGRLPGVPATATDQAGGARQVPEGRRAGLPEELAHARHQRPQPAREARGADGDEGAPARDHRPVRDRVVHGPPGADRGVHPRDGAAASARTARRDVHRDGRPGSRRNGGQILSPPPGHDQDRRSTDVRLRGHGPAGARPDQLHLRRPPVRDHAGAAAVALLRRPVVSEGRRRVHRDP